jgi:sugar phosphate isomerase/epimerase
MTFPNSYSIISDEVSQDLAVIRAFVREFKLPGIELRSLNGRAFKDLTNDDVAAISAAARDEGWKIIGCSTPVFKCEIDDAKGIREHRDIFKRSLEVARELDSNLLRIFTFLRKPNPTEPQRLKRVTEELLGLVEIAKGSGVKIGIENEHSCLVATVEEMLGILGGLPADQVGAIWDPCNVLYVPEAAPPAADNLTRLGDRLFHIHLKDAVRRSSTKPGALIAVGTPVGIGEVNWREHLQTLQRMGYRGMLSLETHWRLQQIDESMLHLPAGHAFSHGGDVASRTCFHNIKALAETL